MKTTFILILLALSNFAFAQNIDKNFSITILANNFPARKTYKVYIVKNDNIVKIKYAIFDSTQSHLLRKDTNIIKLNHRILAEKYRDTSFNAHGKLLQERLDLINKYNVYDEDSVTLNLSFYPAYNKILNSVYVGINISESNTLGSLYGTLFNFIIKSPKFNRTFQVDAPSKKSNPTLYHLIRNTFTIYRKLSEHPLALHKYTYPNRKVRKYQWIIFH